MSKRIKMVLYGEPGVGKSVFACHAPKPFFICSDGNYEWLSDFGADENAHKDVGSWSEAKEAFQKNYDDYETIVVDLTEDLFKWCEYEYCLRNKIEHLSDLGYGKGYDASRNEFFIELCKLLSKDKNIIMIMHGLSVVEKDRRGVEHTRYVPSSRIPDKVIDMIEGRVRYFLRCYVKDIVHEDGTVEKKRYLSLVPKPNEFGIIRGVNENKIPQDIPLDWGEFVKAIGYSAIEVNKTKDETSPDVNEENAERVKRAYRRRQATENVETSSEKEKTSSNEEPEQVQMNVKTEEKVEVKSEPEKPAEEQRELTNAEKLERIKAKLAMIKENK